MAASGKASPNYGVGKEVADYLQKHQNRVCTVTEMSEVLGYTQASIKAAISNLRAKKAVNIETVLPGKAWRVAQEVKLSGAVEALHEEHLAAQEAPAASRRAEKLTFEEVGRINYDIEPYVVFILRDGDDKIYRAVELS